MENKRPQQGDKLLFKKSTRYSLIHLFSFHHLNIVMLQQTKRHSPLASVSIYYHQLDILIFHGQLDTDALQPVAHSFIWFDCQPDGQGTLVFFFLIPIQNKCPGDLIQARPPP